MTSPARRRTSARSRWAGPRRSTDPVTTRGGCDAGGVRLVRRWGRPCRLHRRSVPVAGAVSRFLMLAMELPMLRHLVIAGCAALSATQALPATPPDASPLAARDAALH